MRIVCISNNPFPYHTPILNQLNRLADLHVVYMSRTHPLGSFDDDWGEPPQFPYSLHWSKPLTLPRADFRAQVSCGVSQHLRRLKPDVILFSSWGPLVVEPVLWKVLARRRAVMWAESTRFSGFLRGRLSNGVRRFILSNTDAYVANGTQAALFLGDLGVPQKRIVASCLPSPLTCCTAERRPHVGTPDAPRFLYVGRLIERKRPLQLLAAFATVLQQMPSAALTIVGNGPLEAPVAEAAAMLGDRVQLLGRREGRALSEVYLSSDVLVVPSVREVWGLVVNEALAHGVDVVATDQVGAAFDLLDGENGRIVPADDTAALAHAMYETATERAKRSKPASVGASHVSSCTPLAFAQSLAHGARLALSLEDQ